MRARLGIFESQDEAGFAKLVDLHLLNSQLIGTSSGAFPKQVADTGVRVGRVTTPRGTGFGPKLERQAVIHRQRHPI
ncbi:MAG: hypothetical protein LBJ09_00005 [Clostridiales bacterium]|nr:hypothetical protein [Clostridiales bacterium]